MTNYLITESGDFLLKEDNSKIILNEGSSPSSSLSSSLSPSSSVSPSKSPSPSASLSPSASISISISSSISPSPSLGYSLYSRGTIGPPIRYLYGGAASVRYTYGQHLRYGGTSGIVVDDSDLDTIYTEQEEVKVAAIDTDWVGQEGALVYMLHQFKSFIGDHSFCTAEWVGKSTLPPSLSTVYFQIYNRVTGLWETFDTNTTSDEDLDFELEARIPDTTNYKSASGLLSCRVYQLAI